MLFFLSTAYCQLSTVNCLDCLLHLLPTAYCLLPTVNCSLFTDLLSPIETAFAADFKVATYTRTMIVMFAASRVEVEPYAGAVQFTFGGRCVVGDVTLQWLLQLAG